MVGRRPTNSEIITMFAYRFSNIAFRVENESKKFSCQTLNWTKSVFIMVSNDFSFHLIFFISISYSSFLVFCRFLWKVWIGRFKKKTWKTRIEKILKTHLWSDPKGVFRIFSKVWILLFHLTISLNVHAQ